MSMAISDKQFDDLNSEVKHLRTLLTGGDIPDNGILIKLDRLLQLCESAKRREERIIQFALLGVGSGATGLVGFLASLVLWWITKGR